MRSYFVAVLVVAVSLSLTVAAAQGQDTYWKGAAGTPMSWATASNWTLGVPTAANNAYISNGGTATISGAAVNDNTGNLYLGVNFSGSSLGGNVIQSSGTLNTTLSVNAGVNAQGNPSSAVYTMNGGLLTGDIAIEGGFFTGRVKFSQLLGNVCGQLVGLCRQIFCARRKLFKSLCQTRVFRLAELQLLLEWSHFPCGFFGLFQQAVQQLQRGLFVCGERRSTFLQTTFQVAAFLARTGQFPFYGTAFAMILLKGFAQGLVFTAHGFRKIRQSGVFFFRA